MPYLIKNGKKIELDPRTGQPIAQQAPMAGGATQPAQKEPSFLEKITRALVKPAVDFGNMVGGAAYEVPRGIKAKFGDYSGYMDASGKEIANPFLKQEELEKFSKPGSAAVEGAKRYAGVASYFVPGGKVAEGAGVAAKIFQGAKVGAQAGGLYGFSQSKGENVEDTAVDTVKGAITGGAFGGAMGAVGGAVSKFKGAKFKNQKNILKPEVGNTPDFLQKGDELTQKLVERNLVRNNSDDTARAVGDSYRELTDEVGAALEKSTKTKSWGRQEAMIRKQIAEDGKYFIPGNPAHERLLEKYIALVRKQVTNGKVNAKIIFDSKMKIGEKVGKAFDKEDDIVASAITDPEGVGLDMWRALDDIITDIEPSVKNMTKEMSLMHQVKTGLKKTVEKSNQARVFGISVGPNVNKTLQNVNSGVANAVDAVGSIPGAIPGAVKNGVIKGGAMLTNSVGDFFSGKGGQPQAQPPAEAGAGLQEPPAEELSVVETDPNGEWQTLSNGNTYSMDGAWIFDEASDDWVENPDYGAAAGGDKTNPEAPMSLAEYNANMSALSQSNSTAAVRQYGLMEKERDYYYPADAKTPKLSEGDKKFAFAKAEAQKALDVLDTDASVPVGPLSGSYVAQKGRQLTGNQTDSESNFLSKVAISRTAARNALLGANMSDKEMESLLEFTFDASLPREVLRQRIASFIDSMDGYMQTIAGPEALPQNASGTDMKNYFLSEQ